MRVLFKYANEHVGEYPKYNNQHRVRYTDEINIAPNRPHRCPWFRFASTVRCYVREDYAV